jgi:hypothetical protein
MGEGFCITIIIFSATTIKTDDMPTVITLQKNILHGVVVHLKALQRIKMSLIVDQFTKNSFD